MTENLLKKYQKHENDTGSSAVQVVRLSERIRSLSSHFETAKKDYHSLRGMKALFNDRKRHLRYLKRTEPAVFSQLVSELDIRFRD